MIVKNSQLQHIPDTQWPTELTPQQREQLLQEKLARMAAWYQVLKKHDHIRPRFTSS
jgi:Spy/CpxP family protein refolding chaperone